MASLSSPRSPIARSEVSSPRPRPKFDSDLLKAYMKKLLTSTLHNNSWPEKNSDRVQAWIKDINERVKGRMVEIQPKGFKYIVFTQINENLGQGGRAGMACHWEESDMVAQELYCNVRISPEYMQAHDSAYIDIARYNRIL